MASLGFQQWVFPCGSVATKVFCDAMSAQTGPAPWMPDGSDGGIQKSWVAVRPATTVTGAAPVKLTLASLAAGSSRPASQVKAAV